MCSLWVYLLTVFMTHWSHPAKGDISNDLIPAENGGHKEIFGPEREKQTCQEGARQCHSDAVCMDYTDGFCCSCVSPAFGNGKHCVTTTDHHRIYGKVSGRLNGVSFDQLVMYAFVQTKTGRVYTAFSNVPDEISSEVITLNTIGGVFGWMFALKEGPGAKNGFMLTGGDLNRTARIQYKNGEKVVIEQMYMYHETSVPDKIQMETVIDGNIPKLKYRDQITIEDYNEVYRRVSPGIIRVSSDHTFHVNTVSSRFTLDQEIIFDECAFDPLKDKKDSQRLSVTRTFAVFEPDDKVVRFAMSYKIQRVTALFCPRPSQIQHGTIFQDATYGLVNDYKSVLEYSCDRGYYVNGNTQIQKVTRTCQSDGKWSGKEPTCEEGRCVFYPSKLRRVCLEKDDDGYCAYGQFSIQSGTSIKVRCTTGDIWRGSNYFIGRERTITCNKGHYPNLRCPSRGRCSCRYKCWYGEFPRDSCGYRRQLCCRSRGIVG